MSLVDNLGIIICIINFSFLHIFCTYSTFPRALFRYEASPRSFNRVCCRGSRSVFDFERLLRSSTCPPCFNFKLRTFCLLSTCPQCPHARLHSLALSIILTVPISSLFSLFLVRSPNTLYFVCRSCSISAHRQVRMSRCMHCWLNYCLFLIRSLHFLPHCIYYDVHLWNFRRYVFIYSFISYQRERESGNCCKNK